MLVFTDEDHGLVVQVFEHLPAEVTGGVVAVCILDELVSVIPVRPVPGLGCQRIVVLLQRIFDAREFLAGLLVLGFHEDRLEYNSFDQKQGDHGQYKKARQKQNKPGGQ